MHDYSFQGSSSSQVDAPRISLVWQIYHYERHVGCFNLPLLIIFRENLKTARSASRNKKEKNFYAARE